MILDFKTKRIGVICGGNSCEREVSLRSGKKVFEALQSLGYHSVLIDSITKIDTTLFDIAFIALHGKGGEDGVIQGYFEAKGIPYTGSRIRASVIGMDKELTKLILKNNGLSTPEFEMIGQQNLVRPRQLNFPVIIKPTQEGSSVGIEIADDPATYQAALQRLYKKYTPLMAEHYISGQEITVGVLEIKGVLTALPVLEVCPKNRFYDYEAKYTHGMTEFIIPANLSKAITEKAQEIAIETHRVVGCSAMSRVDMIVPTSGEPTILEINTIPGMTDLSDLPAQANAYGITYEKLVDIILLNAQ